LILIPLQRININKKSGEMPFFEKKSLYFAKK